MLLQEAGIELSALVARAVHNLDVKWKGSLYADDAKFGQRASHAQDGFTTCVPPYHQFGEERVVIGSDLRSRKNTTLQAYTRAGWLP